MSISSLFKSITQGVVNTFDDAWGAVSHIFSNDVEPFLKASVALIERNGGSLLLTIASQAVPDIATGNWTALTVQIVADLKAAGAATVAAEEQLAASTALQMAQATAAALASAGKAAPATTPPADAPVAPSAVPVAEGSASDGTASTETSEAPAASAETSANTTEHPNAQTA